MSRTSAADDNPMLVLVIGQSEYSHPTLQSELSAVRPDVDVEWSPRLQVPLQFTGCPDVVVVLQDHPDQASPRRVRDLLNTCPLSRLIVCEGPWCESAGRTRQLWPAACRVPVHRLLPRLRHELAVVRGSTLPLPVTANRDECWEYDFTAGPTRDRRPLVVSVSTHDPAMADWLNVTLRAMGHRIIDPLQVQADVLLFDTDPWTVEQAEALSQIIARGRQRSVVALTGSTWSPPGDALRRTGVRSVVSKLAPLSELCRALDEASETTGSQQPGLHVVTDS